jgi:2-dehydropantoate 2-reductase
MLKILVVGSGAMAKFVVAQIHHKCSVFTLGNFWDKEFVYQNQKEKFTIQQYQNFNPNIQYDCVFWFTSTVYNERILDHHKTFFSSYTGLVLNFQNGMGYENLFLNYFPNASIYFGSTTQAVLKDKNGITDTGKGVFYLDISAKNNSVLKLISSSLTINFIEDIEFKRLQKLSINVVINPVTAYFKIKNGEILTQSEAWEMAGKIIKETFPFWRNQGIYPSMLKYEDMVVDIAEKTSQNFSSMCSAKINNMPLETSSILDFIYQKTQSKTLEFLLENL